MQIQMAPIGEVSCPVRKPVDENWGKVVSRISLYPAYVGGLDGLTDFSHAIVVTFLHRAEYDPARCLRRRPRGLATMPLVGIFAQRAKDRPNPIGVTAVKILSVKPDCLEVQGLDAVDGTPVLDVKPYYPHYDLIADAKTPAWVDELMKGYF